MTNIRSFPSGAPHGEPVTAEEGLRLIKTFESIPRKSDRDAVLTFAERLACLGASMELTASRGESFPDG